MSVWSQNDIGLLCDLENERHKRLNQSVSHLVAFRMVWVAIAITGITKDITVTQLNRTVIEQHLERIIGLLEQTVLELILEGWQWTSWQNVPELIGSDQKDSTADSRQFDWWYYKTVGTNRMEHLLTTYRSVTQSGLRWGGTFLHVRLYMSEHTACTVCAADDEIAYLNVHWKTRSLV